MDRAGFSRYYYRMTHSAAVNIIVNLVPEIEKSGAERVLTDYATREKLTPAKLEKLAQVYNTLRQVSHIDNAEQADRGATVSLVDVPGLVLNYATQDTSSLGKAAAAPIAVSSHDPRVVDLTSALRVDLRSSMQKAAAAVPPAEAEQKLKLEISRDELSAALLDVEIELEHSMSKLAGELFAAAPKAEDQHFVRDVSRFEADALRSYHEAGVRAAGDYLEKFAAPHRTRLIRHDYEQPLVKFAYPIASPLGEKFVELAAAVTTLEIVKRANSSEADQEAMLRDAYQNYLDAQVNRPPSPDADMPFTPGQTGEAGLGAGSDLPPTDQLLGDIQASGLTSQTTQEPAGRSGSSDDEDDRKKKKGDDGGSGKSGGKGGANAADRVLDAIAAPIASVSNAITGASQKANEALSSVVSKERTNKAQRDSDMSVADIQRAMRLRRLIGTDPVLREADPRAVLEVYNAVAARNPDIADDMASLRLILREAVSYEGLTLEAQKTLSEIRRNSSQGQKESDELDRKRYSAGGSNPISFA